jgi:putative PIN family toxin of toxin-antitoxin system
LNSDGYERHVLDLGLARKLEMVASESILDEYEKVLKRPKFAIQPELVKRSLRIVRAASRIVSPARELSVTRDPADNRFIECADAGKAHYLVTGNKRHFPERWRQTMVVNAREVLEWVVPELRR